jgi:RNA polymerase-interacting CarD/CdnL/TRCF family regulator
LLLLKRKSHQANWCKKRNQISLIRKAVLVDNDDDKEDKIHTKRVKTIQKATTKKNKITKFAEFIKNIYRKKQEE